jgi:hypothetical protein
MSVRKFALLVAAAGLFGAGAGVAQAADGKARPLDFTVRTETSPIAPGSQTLKWDAAKGHWGVMLNMQQPAARAATANDIQAGAFYRITPSLRVGGSLALGEEQVTPGPKPSGVDPGQPRVQLETKFKF